MPSWPILLVRWLRSLNDEIGLLLINLIGIIHIIKFWPSKYASARVRDDQSYQLQGYYNSPHWWKCNCLAGKFRTDEEVGPRCSNPPPSRAARSDSFERWFSPCSAVQFNCA